MRVELTDWCGSVSLYAVDGEARWIANTQSLVTNGDKLDSTRTLHFFHGAIALLRPVQFIHVNRPLASDAETRAGSLANKSRAHK